MPLLVPVHREHDLGSLDGSWGQAAMRANVDRLRMEFNLGGVIHRLVDQLSAGVFDVRDYGAKGDGVTDNTAAIQAALDAVPEQATDAWFYSPRGAEVVIGPGAFLVSSGLTMKRGTRLRGAGKEATVIISTQTTGDILSYIRPASAMNPEPLISIKDLTVAIQYGVTHTSGACVRVDSLDPNSTNGAGVQVEIENVHTRYGHDGFRFRNVLGGTIRNCRAHYCGYVGFIFRGFQTMLSVESCWAAGCASRGWDIAGPAYCRWTACGADSCADYGWYIGAEVGGQSIVSNHWHIGSEWNGELFHFRDCAAANTAILFGVGATTAPVTGNGLYLNNVQGFTCTPYISGSAACTGCAILVEANCELIVFLGGSWSAYAVGGLLTSGATDTITQLGCLGGSNNTRFPKSVRMAILEGVGTRAVVAAANGELSAP